jgi:glutaredoxin
MAKHHEVPDEPVPGASRSPKVILTVMAVLVIGGTAAVWGWLTAAQRLGADVARLAQPGDIRMIASLDCTVCGVARQWFEEHRVPFGECMIERDARCRAEFEALQAQGTPVLMVRGQPIMGFDPHRVRTLLGG